jgi:predicted metalloprotease with PDZ domain
MNLNETLDNKKKPSINYQVAMSEPKSHLFEVRLNINNWHQSYLDLKMPVWTPGSYLVREYSRHIQELKVINGQNKEEIKNSKISKNHWQINTDNINSLIINYKVFANELTVRTNHLDDTHGYFNGTALFFYIPDLENLPITISIIPPQVDWIVSTSLPLVKGENNTFIAENFDTLVDSPFEIGKQKIYDFEVLGKPHQWIVWGQGNMEIEQLIKDTKKIIETEAKLFDGLPYDRYFFLLHLSSSGFGGLEHKNCCSLNYPRFGFKKEDKYHRFLQLVVHEFFHLWNVKRIRPKALEKFNYDQENYTTSLWFCEGTTSYYDTLIPLRAKIYDRQNFLKLLGNDISKYLDTYGRNIQPLRESSFDAWIKLYRRDAYSDNCQISYYLKGKLVSLLLDLIIRKNSKNQHSLDNVMSIMWNKFGKDEIGYTPNQLKEVIETVAKIDLTEFFTRYLDTTEELPFPDYFEPFGLELKPVIEDSQPPYLGINITSDRGKESISFVTAKSPAAIAGIDIGDEILALDGVRVTGETINDRLNDYQAGDVVEIAVFHEEELKILKVKLHEPKPQSYELKIIENCTSTQKELLNGWL